jgi:cation transport regulator ChaB
MPPKKADLPSTLQRSPAKAQRTYAETLESAEESYGKGQRASRTAWSAVKHSFEKRGDHWEPKDHKGPSDAQAARSTPEQGRTAGGVDVRGHTKDELLAMAREAGISGRSKMSKAELADALRRHNDRETRRARERDRKG